MDKAKNGREQHANATLNSPSVSDEIMLSPHNLDEDRTLEQIGADKMGRPWVCCSSSPLSQGSALDRDVSSDNNSPILEGLAYGAKHSESSAAYFLWPPAYRLHGRAEDRTTYFYGLQKDAQLKISERIPIGSPASTLLDVMIIRAYHSKLLRRVSLGTAVGFRTRQGRLTKTPAIIVFVARKVHKAWLQEGQRLPTYLEGPAGIWCDVDVVEFSYFGTLAVTPKEEVYTELVEGLRGNSPCIGPGSQVASQETYGTLGAIVQSRTGARQVGFLTNRHVAVDLDYPNQKMFHPLPPNFGPSIYLGAVERATSFIADERWYSIFASVNPETFVRADGAFIPFGDSFDMSRVSTTVKGLGEMGDVFVIDLQASISSIVGRKVVKVGRSSGLTKGSIIAYAFEYNDEKGICFFTDFLIVGENMQAFDLQGDSGSLVLMDEGCEKKPRPVGIIWGGTANRGRLKLRNGHMPENWTSAVDLGRLLNCLQLDLITTDAALKAAVEKQRRLAFGISTVGEASSRFLGSIHFAEANQQHSAFEIAKPKTRNPVHHSTRGELHQNDLLGAADIKIDLNRALAFAVEPIDFMHQLDSKACSMNTSTENGEHQCLSVTGEDLAFSLDVHGRDAKRRWMSHTE